MKINRPGARGRFTYVDSNVPAARDPARLDGREHPNIRSKDRIYPSDCI
jgi:hypothetical protein